MISIEYQTEITTGLGKSQPRTKQQKHAAGKQIYLVVMGSRFLNGN